MFRTRRPLAILGSAAVALLLVSCGVDAGDSAATGTSSSGSTSSDRTTTTTGKGSEPDKELTPLQQQMADSMAEAYKGLGFTDEEAACLSEGIAGSMEAGDQSPDITGMMDVINQCDIPMDRLMDIQGDMGDGTPEGALKESFAAGLKAQGMSEEDATCVADAFVDEYGVDPEAMMDPSKLGPIADQCGVDVTKIRPGG